MSLMDALKERIELAESMIRNLPVVAVNIRLSDDSALVDLVIAGSTYKDQPYYYRQFFKANKLREFSLN
jgi:hypothetical protein